MKIRVFSQNFDPENFRINALCRELVTRGHEVTVVTGYPQYPLGRIYDGYGFDIPYDGQWNGVKICRVKVHPRGSNLLGMLRNTVDYVVQANRWVKNCRERFDAVYVFEVSPVTVGLPAVTYKKKFGVPMFFNLQDLWPENVEEVLGIRFGPLTWLINRIVDRIYGASNKILCASNGFADNLRARGVPEKKIAFWPQFCLTPNLTQAQKPEIYREDTFNIVFAGNLGDAQGLDLMVEAARELKGGPALNKAELQTFHDRLAAAYTETLSGDRPVLGKMKELWFYMGVMFQGADKPLKAIRKAKNLADYSFAAQSLFRDCDLIPGGKFRQDP